MMTDGEREARDEEKEDGWDGKTGIWCEGV